ncbi:unnamed protein product [Cuscuta campestris]|uniref:Uncharacterized protein n=2 Tax=Cuscuta sect. Cleistogrammica TaxID=1824901 RepID=A0A484MW73_9ASTE|nr:hypothetical protein DM860_014228 [Cuscuta australis]VFQ92466.1 unnamed protein product [Cuscuta campestris]
MSTERLKEVKDYVRVLIFMVQATGTLIAAVVMAAGFTGDHKTPRATTTPTAAFYAFAVSDALAFACSLSATFAYSSLAASGGSPSPPFSLDGGGCNNGYSNGTQRFARSMLVSALFALAVAFAAGLYSLLLAHPVAAAAVAVM